MHLKHHLVVVALAAGLPVAALAACPYDSNRLDNPYGAGNPYKSDELNNPYSPYGSPYSNKSRNKPYATDAPKLYDGQSNYSGRLSANPYDPDSTSNPYGKYGSKYSQEIHIQPSQSMWSPQGEPPGARLLVCKLCAVSNLGKKLR